MENNKKPVSFLPDKEEEKEWNASPKKKAPLSERLDRLSDKLSPIEDESYWRSQFTSLQAQYDTLSLENEKLKKRLTETKNIDYEDRKAF